jgi:regulator of nonsense transcripts 3
MSSTSTSTKPDESLKKVVVRRLPPTLTKDQFLEVVAPLPDYDYFCYCKADLSLGQNAYCRAYVSFLNSDDVYIFKEKFDNYVFVDSKSNEYPALVEYAPYQRKLRNNLNSNELKKDSKCNTIDQDPEYIKFLENIDKPDGEQLPSCEIILEQIEQKEKDMQFNGGSSKLSTPLLDYLRKKREDRRNAQNKEREMRKKRDEERRKRRDDEAQRRKEEDERRNFTKTYQKSSVSAKPQTGTGTTPTTTKNSSVSDKGQSSSASSKTQSAFATAKAAQQQTNKQTPAKAETKDAVPMTSNETTAASTSVKSNEQLSEEAQEKEQLKRDRVRNKDRPSIEIYNPAQRAAQRRQQPAPKD